MSMEKPCILATTPGPKGIYARFASCIEKHFTIIPYEAFCRKREDFKDKIRAVFVWGITMPFDLSLLQSLPNLKVVVNGGVGVDHLDIPLINSFGVMVCNTPGVVNNATADIGMALILASARKILEGLVIDQDALVDALQRKVIRAAALDVTYPEPLPRDHPLLSMPNVIVLPHMGTHTVETNRAMVEQMVTNTLAALNGEQPPDEVKLMATS